MNYYTIFPFVMDYQYCDMILDLSDGGRWTFKPFFFIGDITVIADFVFYFIFKDYPRKFI